MTTIKDIAELANVSATTVSLILNGKAKERRITEATIKRVTDAMKELDYKPNLSARRLRNSGTARPVIALYWPLDTRVSILAVFLNVFRMEARKQGFDCELVIQTFENDRLKEDATAIIQNSYSGIIVGAASVRDIEYLESISPRMPVVLINRSSGRFYTVSTDQSKIGTCAARLIHKKGHDSAVLIGVDNPFLASGLRTRAFLEACAGLGIRISQDHIIQAPNTMAGGALAARAYCSLHQPPKMVFFESDYMALGALGVFHEQGIRIPEDLEMLAIAMMDSEYSEFSYPPLSTINMPIHEILNGVITILMEQIRTNNDTPVHVMAEAGVTLRKSF